MLACLEVALGAILSSIGVILNLFCELYRLITKSKANIDPKEHVVVITGCDSGFGNMAALQLTRLKFRVVAGTLTEEACTAMKSEVALAVQCDVTKKDDIIRFVKETEAYCVAHKYKVWAVVNNAGIGPGGCMDWYSMDLYRKLLEVNLFGLIAITKAFLPLLKRSPGARYINISSLAGILGGSKMTAYCASKHAVEGFAKCLRVEMVPWGLHVCNINPGFMKTPLLPAAMEATRQIFLEAPADIQRQYDPHNILEGINPPPMEDPQLVVDSIIEAVWDQSPPLNYYPGKQAMVMQNTPVLRSSTTDCLFASHRKNTCPAPTKTALAECRND